VNAVLKPAPGTTLTGLLNQSYRIVKELQAGQHASSFLAETVDGPKPSAQVFVKTPYVAAGLGFDRAVERLDNIEKGFKREYYQRKELDGVPNVARVLDYAHVIITEPASGYEFIIPCLIQEFIDGKTLDEYLVGRFATPLGSFSGIPDQGEWFLLARKILEIVQRVHNRSIVHGDIWPPNILMVGDQPFLVDFGQSFIVAESFHEAGGSVRSHPYLAPERDTEDQTWYSPADIFALGGLLHFMASGRPPEGLSSLPVDELQATIHATIKKHNPKLSKDNMGIAKVIDKCMRPSTADRYPYVESVVEALDIFDYSRTTRGSRRDDDPATALSEVASALQRLAISDNALFGTLARSELSFLRMRVDSMVAGNYEILGHREELINSLLRYLGVLAQGDEYATITVPSFWSERNLGINGRFLTMNKMMALRGVAVRRVFMLCEEDRTDDAVIRVLQAHLAAARELEAEGVETHEKRVSRADPRNDRGCMYYCGYIVVTEDYRRIKIERGDHVAIWTKRDTDDRMAISFASRPDTHEIGKVRFSSSHRLREVLAGFEQDIGRSQPLAEFLVGTPVAPLPLSSPLGASQPGGRART
jgi:serine/threonine protein kinase